jgi:hypothetical protein
MISDKELEIIIDQCDHGIPRGKTGLREFAVEIQNLRRKVKTLNHLKELMGYVQNGSDETVSLFQDDATMDYMLRVGKKTYWGLSLENVIEKAFEAEGSRK